MRVTFFFDELEAVLGTSAPHPTPPSLQPVNNFESEFGDLEQLLEQVDGGVNAAPTAQSAIGQRLQPRTRTPKTKLFDQTMRVPVKQLDNLSNLIGELVVKRNALEDDEERMRQSLDNLLNQ
ncbi:MAG: hybrid sensor histidine kinase/response regulator, partial [Hydrococcus sp. RM1_1_31]|nr:hybrid sensor histidine kinase/response regulator [Hydrococcus sp. RM1_1_31]